MQLFFYLPTFLTIIRALSAVSWVPYGILYLVPASLPAASCIAFAIMLAALTDFADGFIARRYGSYSLLGEILDPVADKALVLVALIAYSIIAVVSIWPVIVFLFRELLVMTVRAYAAQIGKPIAVERLGKYKTALQMVLIVLLPISYWQGGLLSIVCQLIILVAVALSCISCYHYCNQVVR
ncbi:CDP-diacylglycerol--glycerol-3-phosphate 3-phosphatidyltransferase [Candidatus Dependentiae bacterium]|nr:CDP-diacylglycerol--glycerol-3-phosphate 3-phosphatidyltransferase [Candidatus Dependentiae bacterium]